MKNKLLLDARVQFYLFLCFLIFSTASCEKRNFYLSCNISEISQIGINHFQPFIEAMEKYKIDKGKYPNTGTDLIPDYLDKIPVIAIRGMVLDDPRVKVLKNDKITNYKAFFADGGAYFSVSFYPEDDRICLTGRNNICEYTSETKQWGCYQH